MTDATETSLLTEDARTRRRNAAERRFRLYGLAALVTGIAFLAILLVVIGLLRRLLGKASRPLIGA